MTFWALVLSFASELGNQLELRTLLLCDFQLEGASDLIHFAVPVRDLKDQIQTIASPASAFVSVP